MKLVRSSEVARIQEGAGAGKHLGVLREVASALAAAVEAVEAAQCPEIGTGLNFYEEVQRFETALIQRALKSTGGNQSQAARLLGLKQTTLHGKIKQYGIHHRVLIFGGDPLQAAEELHGQEM